jgi:cellulose synthase/poly-beta-1,6-N-acetylglucosamine synthase-like glycosyltransferase
MTTRPIVRDESNRAHHEGALVEEIQKRVNVDVTPLSGTLIARNPDAPDPDGEGQWYAPDLPLGAISVGSGNVYGLPVASYVRRAAPEVRVMRMCVLIPAKNEHLGIGRTLRSILGAGMAPSDVYLVDDGSKDGAGGIGRSFGVNVLRNETNIGKASSPEEYQVKFCVVIPAKDEKLGIGKTVRSVLAAGASPTDVYVMDDGSSDGTGDIAKSFGVNVLRNEKNVGKAKSILRATQHWKLTEYYDTVCLMDADTEVNGDYFQASIAEFNNPKVAAVCGRAMSVPHNWLTAYRSLAYWISHAIYKGGQSSMGVITVVPGCAASFRADVFAQLEWSPDTIVEDMDCTIQVHRKRLGEIIYQPKALVFTQDPSTLHGYVKQMYRWDVGAWQVGRKYGMTTGLSKIDLEYKLLMGEGITFATMILLTPLWLFLYPLWLGRIVVGEFAFQVLLATICAICDRRRDVLFSCLAFPLIRFVDCAVFVTAFWRVVVRRQQIHTWFAVKRY